MFIGTLSGNIGGDPDMRYTADGKPLLRFSVAHNYNERGQNGEQEKRVEWVRCTIIGPRAESLAQYLVKGTRVTVVGQVKARPWVGQNDNVLHAGLEILVSEVDFTTPRDATRPEQPSGQPARPRPTTNGAQQPAASGAGQGDGDLPW